MKARRALLAERIVARLLPQIDVRDDASTELAWRCLQPEQRVVFDDLSEFRLALTSAPEESP